VSDGGERKGLLDKVLANPLVGLSPWIVYSLVEGEGRLELSAALALGTGFLVLVLNWFRGSSPKMLEFADVTYFGVLAVVVAVASEGTRDWLELWGGETANMALFLIVLGSVLIRKPFTLQYAREDTPREYWDTPEFMRVNYLISWVWVAAFAIEAASGLYGDAVLDDSNNIWTGWIIQTFPLIIAAQFTIWYPARLEAMRSAAQGTPDAAMPTVGDFLATLTPWIIVIGIVVLSMGGAPVAVGVALIVIGAVSTRLLNRPDERAGSKDGPEPADREP
jgi:hypothetical protein